MGKFSRITFMGAFVMSLGLACLSFSCARAPSKKKLQHLIEDMPAQIQSIKVISAISGRETTIEISSSKRAPCTAFKLIQPLRLIVDVTAEPADELSIPDVTEGRIIKAIWFERAKDKLRGTRVVATLFQDIEFDVKEKGRIIRILLSLKEPPERRETQALAARKKEYVETKPRLFFSPGKIKLNQILGIDFFMLPAGRSRIIITTSRKAEYELGWKNSLTLLLHIKGAVIPRELTRYIDSSYFKAAVNRITPIAKAAERSVHLEIELKQMVPYHLTQSKTEIRLDFNESSVKPPPRRISAARLAKVLERREKLPDEVISLVSATRPPMYRRYRGERITLEIVNADIRNILKLIGEVSNLNIVWGPEVRGRVSMRLKNVPWDQALDIVLRAVDLGIVVK